jgi:hypothetical protein
MINWILLIVLQIWQALNHLPDAIFVIDKLKKRTKHREEVVKSQLCRVGLDKGKKEGKFSVLCLVQFL